MAGLVLALVAGGAVASSARALPVCPARLTAEVPLRNDLGFLSAPVAVNGRTMSFIVDTGSEGSLVSPWFAQMMQLPPDPQARTQVSGTGGTAGIVPNVIVRSLRTGEREAGPVSLPVGFLPGRPAIHPPVEGLLGGDILGADALEVDVPGGRMAFWSVGHVPGGCTLPLPAPGGGRQWDELPARENDHRILLQVRLDGHDLTALLDSGARSRILSARTAERMGVTADMLAADPGGITSGVDGRETAYHWHRFHALTIGLETTRSPVLTVAPVSEDVDMLLGADWFAAHRVMIFYRQGRVWEAGTSPR